MQYQPPYDSQGEWMAHLKNQVDPTGTHDLLESLSLIHCPYKVYAIAHQVWLARKLPLLDILYHQ